MSPTIVNLLISVLVGVVTALLATYLALKRFQAEKLWEKKVDAYTQLMSAAHEMKRAREAEIDASRNKGEVPKDFRNQLWEESRNAKRLIFRLSDVASFLVSEEIEKATHELKGELEYSLASDSWSEVMEKERAALDSYIRVLKKVARRELRR